MSVYPNASIIESCLLSSACCNFTFFNSYKFPTRDFPEKKTSSGVTKRKCSADKMNAYPFLAYSKKDDGVYCVPCRLFPTAGDDRGPQAAQLVTEPFYNWKKFFDRMKTHTSDMNRSHFHCVVSSVF